MSRNLQSSHHEIGYGVTKNQKDRRKTSFLKRSRLEIIFTKKLKTFYQESKKLQHFFKKGTNSSRAIYDILGLLSPASSGGSPAGQGGPKGFCAGEPQNYDVTDVSS